jgi:tetratricopeptide (TPR) repeat protein
MRTPKLAALLLAGGVVAAPALARAQGTEADTLFQQGRELLEKGQFAEACPKLARSEDLAPAIGTLLNLGYCWEQLERYRSAMSAYSEAEVMSKTAADAKRAAFARERMAAVEPKAMKVVIRVVPPEPPGLEVTRNGAVVPKTDWGQPIPIDPEEVVVAARAPGREPWKGVVMAKGPGAIVTVFVPPLAEARAGGRASAGSAGADHPAPAGGHAGLGVRRAGAIGLGVGAALSIGAGLALGLAAKARYDDTKDRCDDAGCDERALDIQRSTVAQGNVATALIGLGVVLAGAGVYLWLTGDESAQARAAARGPLLGARF